MDLLQHYKETIVSLSDRQLAQAQPLPESLLLHQEGRLAAYYAPFDYVNPSACVVLVGITPGRKQALNALRAARDAWIGGATDVSAALAAKRTGSFSGALRNNLVALLDHFDVHRLLGLSTAAELFSTHGDLVQFTSVLRYPVFVDGDNFNGSPQRHERLIRMVRKYFVEDVRRLSSALFIPLGRIPANVLDDLVRDGELPEHRVLRGLVHPSPANGERIRYQLGLKSRKALSRKTDPDAIDAMSELLRTRLAQHNLKQVPVLKHIPMAPEDEAREGAEPTVSERERSSAVPMGTMPGVIEQIGYRKIRETRKVIEYECAVTGKYVYFRPEASTEGAVRLVVHPAIALSDLETLPGVGTATVKPMFHSSNMLKFPRRRNRGEKEIPFGTQLVFGSRSDAVEFLQAFQVRRLACQQK